MVMAETKKYHIHRLYDVSYGAMISTDNLKAGRFEDYAALFIEMPVSPQKKRLHIKPGGTYLRAFHQGSYNSLYLRYQEILAYAEEHHLCLHGYSYETGINDIVIDSLEDYITQIEIPVLTLSKSGKELLRPFLPRMRKDLVRRSLLKNPSLHP